MAQTGQSDDNGTDEAESISTIHAALEACEF